MAVQAANGCAGGGGSDRAAPTATKAASPGYSVAIGCVFIFVNSIGYTLIWPFAQSRRDELGCDALCYGSQVSLRSALGLLGSVVLGRLSDRFGRRPLLLVGILGNLLSIGIVVVEDTLRAMWLACIPAALLNQTFAIAKALFTDYLPGTDSTAEAQRIGAIGQLGMAFGFAMTLGSGIGPGVASSYKEAHIVGFAVTVASAILIFLMPVPDATSAAAASSVEGGSGVWGSLKKWATLPVLRLPGTRLLIFLRISMGFAFHVFQTIMTPSFHVRFAFTPADHGLMMSFVGFVYAVAQGFAQPLIRMCAGSGNDSTRLLCACMAVMGLGRIPILLAADLWVVYVFFGATLSALAVINTLVASAASSLAGGSSETGGLYGVLEACEAFAGMVGPVLGGLLTTAESSSGLPHLTLGIVIAVYAVNTLVAALGYRRWIVLATAAEKKSA